MKTAMRAVSTGTPDWTVAAGGVVAVAALAGLAHLAGRADWTELAGETWAVKLHLATAVAAVAIGAVLMAGPKGRALHKRLGWSWAACMLVAALSSFLIRHANDGAFSWIHALSGWVTLSVPMAIAAVRRGNLRVHRRMMSGLFYGGLLLAGGFAFVPGRLLYRAFFG